MELVSICYVFGVGNMGWSRNIYFKVYVMYSFCSVEFCSFLGEIECKYEFESYESVLKEIIEFYEREYSREFDLD